jgi:hypothetical protein
LEEEEEQEQKGEKKKEAINVIDKLYSTSQPAKQQKR